MQIKRALLSFPGPKNLPYSRNNSLSLKLSWAVVQAIEVISISMLLLWPCALAHSRCFRGQEMPRRLSGTLKVAAKAFKQFFFHGSKWLLSVPFTSLLSVELLQGSRYCTMSLRWWRRNMNAFNGLERYFFSSEYNPHWKAFVLQIVLSPLEGPESMWVMHTMKSSDLLNLLLFSSCVLHYSI